MDRLLVGLLVLIGCSIGWYLLLKLYDRYRRRADKVAGRQDDLPLA